jgi:hypothetical protein
MMDIGTEKSTVHCTVAMNLLHHIKQKGPEKSGPYVFWLLPPLNRREINIKVNYLKDRRKTGIPKLIPKLNHCTFHCS